jgi:tetratricopeptide (TPR) repeat protein
MAFVLLLAGAAVVCGQADAAVEARARAVHARAELNEGARAYRDGRFAEAERHFRRAYELDPSHKNTLLFIARAVQQQYKSGDASPENVAQGERAVAAYGEILARDPHDEDAYRATVFLYGKMGRDDKVVEMLRRRAEDSTLEGGKRADALVILASRKWQCSYDLTERAENKAVVARRERLSLKYRMPSDAGDFRTARACVAEGSALIDSALGLAPDSASAWSYRANLLRESAKLAEMAGDARGKARAERLYARAYARRERLAEEEKERKEAEAAARSIPGGVGGGGVLDGLALYKPEPERPPTGARVKAGGLVVVQVVVGEDGGVESAVALSGPPPLRASAVAAARRARFAPTFLSGKAVRVSGLLTYRFAPR